jgi:hypothetical protein
MASHSYPSCQFLWVFLLALLPPWAETQQTFPAIAEIDLIFPRNDTFAPTVLMPVIFAIQNSQLAASLALSFEWTLNQFGGNDSNNPIANGAIDLRSANTSSGDPYFALGYIYDLVDTETTWSLVWSVSAANCSMYGSVTQPGGGVQSNAVFFSTRKGAQQPDLIAATGDNTCSSTESFTFNVTGATYVVPGQDHNKFGNGSACAELATTLPTPTPNPCGVRINSSAASSISTAVTASACSHAVDRARVTCPPTATAAKSDGERTGGSRPAGRMVLLTGFFGWLVYTLVL